MKITRTINEQDLKRIKLAKSAYSNAISEINRAAKLLKDAGVEHPFPIDATTAFNELCNLHSGLVLDKMMLEEQ